MERKKEQKKEIWQQGIGLFMAEVMEGWKQ